MIVKMLENETWYGGCVEAGIHLPFNHNSCYQLNLEPNSTCNQASPLLLSNQGRYIWGEDGFQLSIANGEISLTSKHLEPVLYTAGDSLKDAYLSAMQKFFPPTPTAVIPPENFFTKPQYNTWIELMYDQNQADVLKYAHGILENKMPAGILMVDDGWAEYYGGWRFHLGRFPDAKTMIEQLHQDGFQVMFWICPFISPDSVEFRLLRDKDCLVKNKDNSVKLVDWWNGYSAVLDLSNPAAWDWFKEVCDGLMNDYGVDGFKFDAGDGYFYSDEDVTFGKVTGNEQAMLWNKFGLLYPFNEFRACYRCANLPLVQRLGDKNHSWSKNGVSSLIPNALTQGILGYSYTCPDMIGGGNFVDFLPQTLSFDSELMLRSCAAATLLPMMQFSAAPWRLLDKEEYGYCLEYVKLHEKYAPYIMELALESAKTGEPIIRYLEYVFPHEGYEAITNQFMLGDTLLVAPVLTKGATTQKVALPKGKWKYFDGKIYEGGVTVEVSAKLNELPHFERI